MTTNRALLGLIAALSLAACDNSKDPLLSGGKGGGSSAGTGGSARGGSGGTTGTAGGGASGGGTAGAGASGGTGGAGASGGTGGGTGGAGASGGTGGAGGARGGAGGTGGGGRGGTGGTGGAAGTGGNSDAGADTRLCEQALCTRPYVCVRSCGAPAEYTGCCMCDPPLFDNYSCGDGGTTFACGTVTCGASDVCVRTQTVGGAVITPTDGGCPPGTSLNGNICERDPTWSCAPRPAACGSSLTCSCAATTLCTSGHMCTMPASNQINCTLFAP